VVLDIAYEESGPADGVPVILAASGHEAADHILICDGRFRGEADMDDHVASTASAVDGTTRRFCCGAPIRYRSEASRHTTSDQSRLVRALP
jgi:hypothetical protein